MPRCHQRPSRRRSELPVLVAEAPCQIALLGGGGPVTMPRRPAIQANPPPHRARAFRGHAGYGSRASSHSRRSPGHTRNDVLASARLESPARGSLRSSAHCLPRLAQCPPALRPSSRGPSGTSVPAVRHAHPQDHAEAHVHTQAMSGSSSLQPLPSGIRATCCSASQTGRLIRPAIIPRSF